MSVSDLTQVRGITSGMARCARLAAYAALNTDRDPDPFDLSEYYRRGEVFERLRLAEYDQAYPGRVQRQRSVHWQAAGREFEGRIDGFLEDDGIVIEVVSTVSPSQEMVGHKVAQNIVYQVLEPEARGGLVDVIDPSRLVPVQSIPVHVTDEARDDVHHKIAMVEHALLTEGRDMPERACAKPGEARGRLCPFAATCFAGVEAPRREWTDPDDAMAFQRVRAAKQELDAAKAVAAEKDAAYKTLLDGLELDEGRNVAGNVEINRTRVKARETFQWALAKRAGAITSQVEEVLRPFVKVGEPSHRYTVAVTDAPAAIDFGDEPF